MKGLDMGEKPVSSAGKVVFLLYVAPANFAQALIPSLLAFPAQ